MNVGLKKGAKIKRKRERERVGEGKKGGEGDRSNKEQRNKVRATFKNIHLSFATT